MFQFYVTLITLLLLQDVFLASHISAGSLCVYSFVEEKKKSSLYRELLFFISKITAFYLLWSHYTASQKQGGCVKETAQEQCYEYNFLGICQLHIIDTFSFWLCSSLWSNLHWGCWSYCDSYVLFYNLIFNSITNQKQF